MEEIDAMREQQGNACAICGIKSSDIQHKAFSVNPLVIDHDHATGQVRGLLCPTCNSGLGHFSDDISKLTAAIAYLQRSSQ